MDEAEPKTWCERVMHIMEAIEPDLGDDSGIFAITDESKPFFANAVKELLRAVYPEAKIKHGMTFTPYRVGAFVGHIAQAG